MPVDTYTGGIEHATMHLIYTRFFHKACRDMGIVKGPEPMTQLRNQGIVLGEDSEKMSKSRGNVVAPDDLVKRYGADTVRAYLMFFARWDMGGPWNSSGIEGTVRWVRRVWNLVTEPPSPGTPDANTLRTLAPQGAPDAATSDARFRNIRIQHDRLLADGAAQRDVASTRAWSRKVTRMG